MIVKKIFRKIEKFYIKSKAFLKINKLRQTLLYKLYIYKIVGKKYHGIHLGGGDLRIKDFINIDANPYCNCDIISLINKIKFQDLSTDYIYNSHILEHVPKAEIQQTLSEWHRVLKTGGQLFVCVPDMENLFKIYLDNLDNYDIPENKRLVDLSCGIIYGGQVDKYDFHYMGYSYVTLKNMLESIGFKNIKRIKKSELPFEKPEDASEAILDNRPISLNIVATK